MNTEVVTVGVNISIEYNEYIYIYIYIYVHQNTSSNQIYTFCEPCFNFNSDTPHREIPSFYRCSSNPVGRSVALAIASIFKELVFDANTHPVRVCLVCVVQHLQQKNTGVSWMFNILPLLHTLPNEGLLNPDVWIVVSGCIERP